MLTEMAPTDPVDVLDMLFAEEREAEGRPWVMLNMVTSIDGATALRGGATALNDPDDKMLFLSLRSVADVVMVGAETVRAEALGPINMTAEMTKRREEAGFDGPPRMAILTRSGNIDPGHRVFSDQSNPPVVLTSGSDGSELDGLREVAEVVQVPVLDGPGIVQAFRGVGVVLCEGGPTVNSQLVAGDLVDEINLTISPLFALGPSKRVAVAPDELDPPIEMRLDRVMRGTRSLFARFVRNE